MQHEKTIAGQREESTLRSCDNEASPPSRSGLAPYYDANVEKPRQADPLHDAGSENELKPSPL
jgi:hypothetical protein